MILCAIPRYTHSTRDENEKQTSTLALRSVENIYTSIQYSDSKKELLRSKHFQG